MKKLSEQLKELTMLPGVPGYEGAVRDHIKDAIGKKGQAEEDTIGNLIVRLGKPDPKKPKLGLMAHMDECGFIVSNILDNGTLRFKKLGGLQDRVILGRAVQVHTKKGPIYGVIGVNAPHLMLNPDEKDKIIPWNKLCIDLGTRSRAETEKLGVSMLQPITLKKDFFIMNKKYVVSRGLDNRAGVTGLLETFRNIDEKKLKTEVIFVWGVQEEIGLRGARVIANRIPLDYAIPVDTYSTTDAPGLGDFFEPVYMGEGPVLRMVDARVVATPSFGEKLAKIAKAAKIPIQLGVTGGSTDGMALQESGAATMPIGIPMRYSHSCVEIVHLDDLANFIKLLTAAIYGISG